MIDNEKVIEYFKGGIDCSQIVAGEMAKVLSMDEKELRRMSAAFGGGMMCGETCGAVTGALMVLGLKYGHDEEGDSRQKEILQKKVVEFKEAYHKLYPSTQCEKLLGHNLAIPKEMEQIIKEGSMFTLCPKVVCDVLSILSQVCRD